MKNQTILMIFILKAGFLLAQKPAYQIGKHIRTAKLDKSKVNTTKDYSSQFYGTLGNDQFIIKDISDSGEVFTIYDSDMKMVKSFELKTPRIDGKLPEKMNRFIRDNKVITIYGMAWPSDNKITIYGKTDNFDDSSISAPKILASAAVGKHPENKFIFYTVSTDKSKFLFYERENDDEGITGFHIWLYNDKLELLTKTKINIPDEERKYSVANCIVNNDGKILLIFSYYIQNDNELKEESLAVFGIAENNKLIEIPLVKPGWKVNSLITKTLPNQETILCGLSSENKNHNALFFVRINPAVMKTEKTMFNVLSPEDLKKFIPGNSNLETDPRIDPVTKKSYDPIKDYKLKSLMFNRDGTFRIISQREYQYKSTVTEKKIVTNFNNTCRNDILEFNLDSLGNLVKIISIPKKQQATDGVMDWGKNYGYLSPLHIGLSKIYLGYIYLEGVKSSCYIFNDDSRNFAESKTSKHGNNKFYYRYNPLEPSNLAFAKCFLDSEEPTKNILSESNQKLSIFIGFGSVTLGNGATIVFGLENGHLVLIKFLME